MSNTNTGGPAFPAYEFIPSYKQMMAVGGMTLRDYFAGQAIAGKLLMPGTAYDETDCAKFAYEMADAMLKARGA